MFPYQIVVLLLCYEPVIIPAQSIYPVQMGSDQNKSSSQAGPWRYTGFPWTTSSGLKTLYRSDAEDGLRPVLGPLWTSKGEVFCLTLIYHLDFILSLKSRQLLHLVFRLLVGGQQKQVPELCKDSLFACFQVLSAVGVSAQNDSYVQLLSLTGYETNLKFLLVSTETWQKWILYPSQLQDPFNINAYKSCHDSAITIRGPPPEPTPCRSLVTCC